MLHTLNTLFIEHLTANLKKISAEKLAAKVFDIFDLVYANMDKECSSLVSGSCTLTKNVRNFMEKEKLVFCDLGCVKNCLNTF